MKKIKITRIITSVIASLVILMLVAMPVLAGYTGYFTVTMAHISPGTPTSYSQAAIIIPANVTDLAAQHFITASGTDIRMVNSTTNLPYMLADDSIIPVLPSIKEDTVQRIDITTGNTNQNTAIVLGDGGFFTHVTPALGLDYEIEIKAYIDISNAGYILYNTDFWTANFIRIANNAGIITVTGSCYVPYPPPANELFDLHNAVAIASGIHTIKIVSNATDVKLYIDAVLKDTDTSITLTSAIDPSNWMDDNVTPYAEYIKITVSGVLVNHYQPNAFISGTTLPDRAGAAQNGTITWGANLAGLSIGISALSPQGSAQVSGVIQPGGLLPGFNPNAPDAVGAMTGSDQWEYPIISFVATNSNTPTESVWGFYGLMLMVLVAIAVLYLTGFKIWLACVAGLIVSIIFAIKGVSPWYVTGFEVMGCVAGILIDTKKSF
jgi:hypothetical protein